MPEQPTRILLVEDNDIDVFMIQRLIKRLKLPNALLHAANGEEALKILKPVDSNPRISPPFIVLLDINMPRMNGFELLDALQPEAVLSDVPVYMLTTSTFVSDRKRAAERNVTGYLTKPIEADQLMRILGINTEVG